MVTLPFPRRFTSRGGPSRPEPVRMRAPRTASPPQEDLEAQTSFSDSTTVVEEPQGTSRITSLRQNASKIMGRLAYYLFPCCTGPQSRRLNNIDTCGGLAVIFVILCAAALLLLAIVTKIRSLVVSSRNH